MINHYLKWTFSFITALGISTMAFNLNGFNFNQSVVDSQGRVINTWADIINRANLGMLWIEFVFIIFLINVFFIILNWNFKSLTTNKKYTLKNLKINMWQKIVEWLCFWFNNDLKLDKFHLSNCSYNNKYIYNNFCKSNLG